MGADVLTSKRLVKLAREVRNSLLDFKKRIFNDRIKKEIDEIVVHLDEVAEIDFLENWDTFPVSKKGYLGGKTLSRKEIKYWIDEVARISKGESKLIILPKGDKKLLGNVAGFSAFDGNIYVQKGLTEYEVFHEFKHLEEYMKIGKEKYLNGILRLTGDPTLDLIRTYNREKYVFDEIIKNKNRFNRVQLDIAKDYINKVIKKCEKSGIDLKKI